MPGVSALNQDNQEHETNISQETQKTMPETTVQDIEACRFSSWFPRYRSHTTRSAILRPLPESFIEYLQSDGLVLPEEAPLKLVYDSNSQDDSQEEEWSSDNEDENAGGEDRISEDDEFERLRKKYGEVEDTENEDNKHELRQQDNQEFREFLSQLNSTIEELGSSVFPKLNWSSPQDATWISSTQTLKCTCSADVLLLLKSSDFISHDLCNAYDECTTDSRFEAGGGELLSRPRDFELVLRQWNPPNPSLEFRCFVYQRQLVAISQRDSGTYYPHLSTTITRIEDRICDFFETMPPFELDNFVLDLDLTSERRVRIIDFNPFVVSTDALLFTWPEILELAQTGSSELQETEDTSTHTLLPEIRIVKSEHEASHQMKFTTNRYPIEVSAFSQGAGLSEFVERFADEWSRSRLDEHTAET